MNWGSARQLTGVYAESLTRSSVLNALRAMRTFGTLDRSLKLEFRANDAWMGSTIPNGRIRFDVRVTASDTLNRVDSRDQPRRRARLSARRPARD